jgi:hypothetical protein
MKKERKIRILIFVWSLLFVATPLSILVGSTGEEEAAAVVDKPEMEIIKLRQRPAREVLPSVRPLLSSAGRASADTVTNAIIVIDRVEHIAKVKELISQLDRHIPQVTVRLRFQVQQERDRRLSTRSGVSGVSGERLAIRSRNREQQLMLRVSSGASGYLRIGKEVAFDRFWLQLCGRYGYRFGWLQDYRTVATGFLVKPQVYGNKVDLELVPRISFGGERELIFVEAANRLVVEEGTWQVLGGQTARDSELIGAVLAVGMGHQRVMLLEVRADVTQ